MSVNILFWFIFSVLICLMLFIDIYVTDHRKSQITLRQSIIWSGIWIGVALLFNLLILLYIDNGKVLAIQFLSAYLVEKSLSVDNLFVFLMIFEVMNITEKNQPHILKWGIITAIVMRIVFILIGLSLINLFHPIIYFFAALLMYAAYKMAFKSDKKIDPDSYKIIKFLKAKYNYISPYDGKKFFEKINNKIHITPLLIALLLIEISDLIFAIDSIPAVLAISKEPFIAITSNIFAILGLRALYFALSGIAQKFYLLKYGVSIILFYIGIKMILSDISPIPTNISLIIILFVLTLSILLSLWIKKKD